MLRSPSTGGHDISRGAIIVICSASLTAMLALLSAAGSSSSTAASMPSQTVALTAQLLAAAGPPRNSHSMVSGQADWILMFSSPSLSSAIASKAGAWTTRFSLHAIATMRDAIARRDR
jgi:hypothetical protein